MKMTTEHFDALKAAIEPLDTPERRRAYIEGRFPRSDKVKDLDTRYRWDLFWYSGGYRHIKDPLALNGCEYIDTHIDTALRRIVPGLEGKR